MDQYNIFGGIDHIEPVRKNSNSQKNPMVDAFGPGPEGTMCKQCAHIVSKIYSKRYYKCEKRGGINMTNVTDHRVNWPSCSKFEEIKN